MNHLDRLITAIVALAGILFGAACEIADWMAKVVIAIWVCQWMGVL